MKLTCILCPKGCSILVETGVDGLRITGNSCPRGEGYARKEATAPERTVTSLVEVVGGERPLVPVKTVVPVLKGEIPRVLSSIRGVRVEAPVRLGDEILPNIVATDTVLRKGGE